MKEIRGINSHTLSMVCYMLCNISFFSRWRPIPCVIYWMIYLFLVQPHTPRHPPSQLWHVAVCQWYFVSGSVQCCESVWISPVLCMCATKLGVTHCWHLHDIIVSSAIFHYHSTQRMVVFIVHRCLHAS